MASGGKLGKRTGPPALLTDHSEHDDVLAWLRGVLPATSVEALARQWEEAGQEVHGSVLLAAGDEGALQQALCCSATVARRIWDALRELRAAGGATQALAPVTQQHAEEAADAEQQQQQQQQRSGERREPPRRLPGTLQDSQQPSQGTQRTARRSQRAGSQAPEASPSPDAEQQQQVIAIKPDPEEAAAAAEAWEEQQAAAAGQQGRRRIRRQQSLPPGASEAAAEEEGEGAKQRVPQRQRQRQQQQQQQRGGRQRMEVDGEEAGEEQEAEEEEWTDGGAEHEGAEHWRHEEGEHGISHDAGSDGDMSDGEAQPAARSGRQRQQQQQQQQQRIKAEAAELPSGSRATRRAATASGSADGDGDGDADGGAAAAAAAGGLRRGTRRQQARALEEAQLAGAGRTLRGRVMQERERRQQEDAAEATDEEEEAPVDEQDGEATEDEDEEDWGPLVQEDLGPPAEPTQWRKDWKLRAQQGLHEIFSLMSLEELQALVEAEETWPERAMNVLRQRKKVDGETMWVDITRPSAVATRLVNFLFTGYPDGKVPRNEEPDPINKTAIKQLMRTHADAACRTYLRGHLRPRFQNPPRIPASGDPHKLIWKLWHHPVGPADGEQEVLLGTRVLEYELITSAALEPAAGANGMLPWRAVAEALQSGGLRLAENDDELAMWVDHVTTLSTHPKIKVSARINREPGNKKVTIYLYLLFSEDSVSRCLVSGTWTRTSPDSGEREIQAVDLPWVLEFLDGVQGSPFWDQMNALRDAYQATSDEVTGKGVPDELSLDSPMSFKQFDRVMACVEDIDRGEPPGFRQECDDAFKLRLRPYQRRSLAHMLEEEQAEGGSSRHLWVKLNLPEHPELHCYVSPILHQIRCSTSRIEAEQWVHANGGCGWIALQMGMGKTACAVGAIQMNPPPEGWRANRKWQSPRFRDHLSSVVNNAPHGGTLIAMPNSLIDQWEDEIQKTTEHELSILKMTEAHRTLDAKTIAKYDIVLTTFQLATHLHVLSHVHWWRIIADEPQLQAGGFLADKNHPWFGRHHWLLTGTPINAAVRTMEPSLQFLKLGTWDTLYEHYPPVVAHTLKRFMVRYTKAGSLDGEQNLVLPPVTEKLVEAEMGEVDWEWYLKLRREQRAQFEAVMKKARIDMDEPWEDDDAFEDYKRPKAMQSWTKLRAQLNQLRQAASSALKMKTGAEFYDAARGAYVYEKYWFASKAEAVIEVLEEKEEEEKVLIFSEFPTTLQAIKARLKDIGLGHRALLGSTTAAARGKAIKAFQTDPPTKVFLITHRAGGAGITLTAGTHIILCEPTLNPSFERQAIGRSHRMGQDKPITVTRILMKGTVEEQIKAFAERLAAEAQEEPAELPASTANEANPAANEEVSKIRLEDLRDWVWAMEDEDLEGE